MFIILQIFIRIVYSNDYYVATTGSDSTGDGSVTNPWLTITYSLMQVEGTENNPHTIHVLPGTYSPGSTGEVFPISMSSNIALSGAGSDSTILNAEASIDTPSTVIRCISAENITIKDLKITGGIGSLYDLIMDANIGGGIDVDSSKSIIIERNYIVKNESSNLLGGFAAGGGIRISHSSGIIIFANVIDSNIVAADGAVGGGINVSSSDFVMIIDNIIVNNIAVGPPGFYIGGGLFISTGKRIIICRNDIIENRASEGGGIYIGESLIIRNNIVGNTHLPYYGTSDIFISSKNTIIGGTIGNGNNIINDCLGTTDQFPPPINAEYNYFGSGIDPNNCMWFPGTFDVEPYSSDTIQFKTTRLAVMKPKLDFGIVPLDSTATLNLILASLYHPDSGAVEITGIEINNDIFSVSEDSFSIENGRFDSISVTFAPEDTGYVEAECIITSTSGTETVLLSGKGESTVSIVGDNNALLPGEFVLHPNYPNPFNPVTTIRYELPTESHVTIDIYDITGRGVAELVDGYHPAGFYETTWDGGLVASGVYFVKMTAQEQSAEQSTEFMTIRKIMLVK